MTFGSVFGRVLSPTFQPSSQAAAVAGGGWWDLNGTITSCVAAYQPKGAASYAASKVNLTGDTDYDAVEGTAPDWDVVNGWKSNGYKYLTTGITATNGYSAIVRFSNAAAADRPFIMGGGTGYGRGIGIGGPRVAGNRAFNYGGLAYITGAYTEGVLAVTQKATDSTKAQEYYNGSLVVDNQAIDTGKFGGVIYILNNSGDFGASVSYVQAVAIYDTPLTSTQIGNLTTAMNAL